VGGGTTSIRRRRDLGEKNENEKKKCRKCGGGSRGSRKGRDQGKRARGHEKKEGGIVTKENRRKVRMGA